MKKRLFCFGFGYVAQHLAKVLTAEGWQVAGTSRQGRYYFDGTAPMDADGIAALKSSSHVLVSIPPDEAGDVALRFHADVMRDVAWLGYLSTTGVYGDWRGEWVDESSELRATEPRSLRRIIAEKQWLEWGRETGVPVQCFRLAGIYGPGRNALCQLRNGTAKRVDKPGHVFSRIYVEDGVQALKASMEKPEAGAIYNICDDAPCESREVMEYAAQLLDMEPPPLQPFEAADLSPMARSFYAANRRVCNERMKNTLGIALHYPSYREGLRALMETGE